MRGWIAMATEGLQYLKDIRTELRAIRELLDQPR